MTLVETLVIALVLGLGLFVVSRLMEITRNELKAARTWEVLALLDEALSAYHSVAEAWPFIEATGLDRQKTPSASGSQWAAGGFSSIDEGRRPESGLEAAQLVLAALEAVPESRAVLERVPAMLRADTGERARGRDGETEGRRDGEMEREGDTETAGQGDKETRRHGDRRQGDTGTRGQGDLGDPSAEQATTDNPQPTTHYPPPVETEHAPFRHPAPSTPHPTPDTQHLILDGWGRPLRCLTSGSRSAADRRAVAAGGGRPIFISVGPDGLFGPEDSPAVGDNLRSDELPRNTVMSNE
ncbi:MAG: hypothetical protein AMXMBFR13_30940 [Phycisphaerae bacterium]